VIEFAVPAVPVTRLPFTLTESSVLAIIPARFQSTRLPGKPLLDIAGRTMIEHVHQRAAAARTVTAVMVATDDERIRSAVQAFGGIAVMTSPAHLSATDRLAEVVSTLSCGIVVNVQGDEPLLDPSVIDDTVAPLIADRTVAMSTPARRFRDAEEFASPHVVKVVTDHAGFALYFSRSPIPYARDGKPLDAARAHIGLYAYRRETLLHLASLPPTPLERLESLEQLRALANGIRIRVVETAHYSIGVDTSADLDHVRHLMSNDLVGNHGTK
jgi:3-deoxy-manno-octulosonate cytidylyltransferase (CMP-KDO synthetase)